MKDTLSKYTTEVRFICETVAGYDSSQGHLPVNQILDVAAPKVFNFTFPIFDEAYRHVLEKKILKHFYTREIGLETVGLWMLKLDTKMNEIMPLYNQFYMSELLVFNPLYDVDLTRDHTLSRNETADMSGNGTADLNRNGTNDITGTGKRNGTSETDETGNRESSIRESVDTDERGSESSDTTGKSTTDGTNGSTTDATNTGNHTDAYSDTPQGDVTGVEANKYLTNYRKINDTSTGKNTVSGTDKTDVSSSENATVDTDKTIEVSRNVSNNEDTTRKSTVMSGDSSETTQHSTNTDTEKRTNTQTENRKIDSLDDYLEHVKGKTAGASYSKLLLEFRQTFLNIDMQIIGELEELFMGLW